MTSKQLIKIAVSQCLLGDNVRYDGTSNLSTEVSKLSNDLAFNIIPFCPEVAIGMGTPRLPIQLNLVADTVRAQRVYNAAEDFTDALTVYAKTFLTSHDDIVAVINKKASPSCGYNSTKLYKNDEIITTSASGLFLAELLRLKPTLLVIDEEGLEDENQRQDFLHSLMKKAL